MKNSIYIICALLLAFNSCQESNESQQPTASNQQTTETETEPIPQIDFEEEEKILKDINKQILEAMVVNNDPSVFEKYTHENFRVIAPGGKLENKDEVIRGANSLDVKSISISNEEIIFYDNTAILMGKLDMDGTMKPLGKLGPAKFMCVYIKEDGEWVMVARTITPCAQIAIDRGVC